MSKKITKTQKPPWGDDPYSFVMKEMPVQVDKFCILHDKYAFLKHIIKIKIYMPFMPEIMTYDFHVTTIGSRESVEQHGAMSQYTQINIKKYKGNLEEELSLFCPNPEEQKLYYFNRVTDKKNNEMPLFYGVLFLNDFFPDGNNNANNINNWIDAISATLKEYLFSEDIHPSYYRHWIDFCHEMGANIIQFVYTYHTNDTMFEFEDEETLSLVEKLASLFYDIDENITLHYPIPSVKDTEDLPLKYYLSAVMKSMTDFCLAEGIIVRCQNCNELFEYKKGKKYCGNTCLKSSANKRNYKRRISPTE